ncbi:Fructosamine-3-kinase [Nitrosomonas aestuarii]|uniref:Fructosamine-3-kinase n=1 Tax=Nitrosomonas aestuarii TaxID=52441 RepID=A0A1I4ATN8_9PROT|nr:fructosamine kinase family protein [Nitrosomonas aestuarii]SFK59600.1 Fructosamine-3-kinase [Nitrosomonas aestuarii]
MNAWPEIAKQIAATTQQPFDPKVIKIIGGGCINQTYSVADDHRCFFVKTNAADRFAMFAAEAAGLQEIIQSNTLRAPHPICWERDKQHVWLVLEYLDLNYRTHGNAEEFGKRLAAMHRTNAPQFGWTRDNTIGSTPQINTPSPDWPAFWRTNRLQYQLDLAQTKGYHGKLQKLGEQLLEDFSQFFTSYTPRPSLLHGDLWNGNFSYDHTGQPVVFDPAVYHGDRETDIAMTELFGGFPADFYSAYRHEYPLESGYNVRKVLYNLYHVLNHLNLFGGSYRHQAEEMMNYLLAEIR